MSWDYQRSKTRIQKDLEDMPSIEVKKLERDADLENLLSVAVCREIYGAHVYIEIANFSRLTAGGEDGDDLAPLIKSIHIYQRLLAWIVERVFDGVRVHFQGARIHVLFYRPIDDAATLATRSVLLMLVVRDFLRYVFNPLFPEYENLIVTGGADLGTVIGTQNGMRGERELLFLGNAANHAAKIISTGLRLTSRLYDELPENLQAHCEIVDVQEGVYRLTGVGKDDLLDLTSAHDIEWSRDTAEERVQSDIDTIQLEDIDFAGAEQPIDFDTLSVYNNKDILAASLFADINGFTKFIEAAESDDAKKHVVTALHLARTEFTRVATQDFNAVRVQFQGDRMQALVHLPEDDRMKIARKAVDVAIALQSSMELTLKAVFSGIDHLHLSVGADMGRVVATRLGQRGHRDRLVLGATVLEAAANEERTDVRQIGITSAIYLELADEMKEHFEWKPACQCYVATGLTVSMLERKAEAVKYAAAPAVFVHSSGPAFRVTREAAPGGTPVTPRSSHAV